MAKKRLNHNLVKGLILIISGILTVFIFGYLFKIKPIVDAVGGIDTAIYIMNFIPSLLLAVGGMIIVYHLNEDIKISKGKNKKDTANLFIYLGVFFCFPFFATIIPPEKYYVFVLLIIGITSFFKAYKIMSK